MIPKKALLTGATGGLGNALAHFLAKKDVFQILVGRNEKKLLSLNCPNSRILVSDLIDRKSIVENIWKEEPDLIINNAGFGLYGEAVELSVEEQLLILEIDVKALLEITLEGVKMFSRKNKKGMILNVSSIAGEMATPMMSVYGASKAFVTHFSKSLDYETRERGIRVIVSCPGQFRSNFSTRAAKKPIDSDSKMSFSAEALAKRLWKQILSEKTQDIFDYRYRFLHFITKYVIPESWSSYTFAKNIENRLNKS